MTEIFPDKVYSNDGKTIDHLVGKPRIKITPQTKNIKQSGLWEPTTKNGRTTLTFLFPSKFMLKQKTLKIHENYQPGSVRRISVFNESNPQWVEVYLMKSCSKYSLQPRIFQPFFTNEITFRSNRLQIEFFNSKGSQIAGVSILHEDVQFSENHKIKISNDIFKQTLFSDVKIIVKDEDNLFIPSHKIILVQSSSYFENVLKQKNNIEIQNFSSGTIKQVLEFLCTGKVEIDVKDQMDFIRFCEVFDIQIGLNKFYLDNNQIIDLMIKLDKTDERKILGKYSTYFDFFDFQKYENFSGVSEKLILRVIEHRKLKKEEEFVDILIKWGIQQDSFKKNGNLHQTLKSFIPYITQDELMPTYILDVKKTYPEMFPNFKENSFQFNSKIIKKESQLNLLEKWLKNSLGKDSISLVLGYRGSKDGFSHQKFHSRCDDFKRSVVLLSTESGFIFGGFADADWTGNNKYKVAPNSFLFSLKNPSGSPQMMTPSKNVEHIVAQESSGAIFGSGYDLFISGNCHKNHNSNSLGYPYVYNAPKNYTGTCLK
eukprot:gene881-9792_t